MSVYWLLACLPPAFIAFAHDYYGLLIPHLIACIGGAGYHPAAGGLIRTLYPERIRGQIYSFVWGSSMICGAGAGMLVGLWMQKNPDAFRTFFPVAAALQLAGVLVFIYLSHLSGNTASRILAKQETGLTLGQRWSRLIAPVAHMGTILKGDPMFARYEAAYMTYGVGWMICYALLPILVTSKLHLDYDSIAGSTHVAYWLSMTAMIVPAGLLMDRIGAARSTGLSFALLTLYPIGLILAGDQHQLMIASIVYGLAHAGANVGWMLGPVSLAPSPDKVPHYVAIHATLVGIRGKLFQFAGVGLFTLTHSYSLPLSLAAAAFTWSAVQMWQLDRRMKAAKGAVAVE
jgi:MFS family permease